MRSSLSPASRRCEELTKEIFGDEMAYVPWMRPGFELGLAMQEIVQKTRAVRAIMMGQHGFISWHDDEKRCYAETLRFIEKARNTSRRSISERGRREGFWRSEIPIARAKTSGARRSLASFRGCVARSPAKTLHRHYSGRRENFALRKLERRPASVRTGHQLPGPFLRTKIKPLYVDWNPQGEDAASLKQKLTDGLVKYREDYADYYKPANAKIHRRCAMQIQPLF